MIALIGSRAARWHYPDLWPKCNDTDLIATFEDFTNWYSQNKDDIKSCFPFEKGKKFYVEFNSGEIMEWEIAHPGSTGESFLKDVDGFFIESYEVEMPGTTTKVCIPTMDWLFTLKSSHKYLKDSPHFDKTMRDYHVMKHDLSCQIVCGEWHKAREKATYTRPRPKLNRSKKEFFTPDVPYKYDHDTILCTSITSGWFRAYCYQNYYKILDMYSPEYLEWLDKGLESGMVKPFEGAA
jgi:hypothetical protein